MIKVLSLFLLFISYVSASYEVIDEENIFTIKTKDIKDFNIDEDPQKLLSKVNTWRNKLNMPKEILLVEGDNELYINLDHIDFVKLLLKTVKKRSSFKVKEFYFTKENALENNKNNVYRNQIIFTFTKQS